MNRLEKVDALRRALIIGNDGISEKPGVYRWWFTVEASQNLLKSLPTVEWTKIQKRDIGGQIYYALYFGIAKHLRQRLNWHINQKHNPSAVSSGFLSTLRQTLSALLALPMTQSVKSVNDLMDSSCCLEFCHTSSREAAEGIERDEITHNYYPLNVQGNKGVGKDIVRTLRNLRRQYKR